MSKVKVAVKNPVLKTWSGLNTFIMACQDEDVLAKLMEEERAGRARKTFLTRIHSRISYLRYHRERAQLASS
jgi:hypothetical protein